MNGRAIRIIGIDPGLRRTGWGIVESDGVRLVYVASGVITPPKDDDLAHRLSALFDSVTSVIQSFSPSEAAVEETFVNENPAMIAFLLPKATFESADEADALAIAITHAHHRASRKRLAALTPKVAET